MKTLVSLIILSTCWMLLLCWLIFGVSFPLRAEAIETFGALHVCSAGMVQRYIWVIPAHYSLLIWHVLILVLSLLAPLTSSWPHLRCDVGLEEGGYKWKLSRCYSIVYYYNGAQRYEQFLQVGWLYWALILLGLALCLPSDSVFGLNGAI